MSAIKNKVVDAFEGAQERDRVIFWKPAAPGAALVGRVMHFSSRSFEDNSEKTTIAHFSDCAISEAGGSWQQLRGAQLLLTVELASLISLPAYIGAVLAVQFLGFEAAKNAEQSDKRLYRVAAISQDQYRYILSTATA
jgi:hypothetical protein